MDYEKIITEYVDILASDETKSGGITYILVYLDGKNSLYYNIANPINYLIDNFHEYNISENLPPEKVLKMELQYVNASIGAIFKRDNKKFKLLVKEGFWWGHV